VKKAQRLLKELLEYSLHFERNCIEDGSMSLVFIDCFLGNEELVGWNVDVEDSRDTKDDIRLGQFKPEDCSRKSSSEENDFLTNV
jgi:hypothetical protein